MKKVVFNPQDYTKYDEPITVTSVIPFNVTLKKVNTDNMVSLYMLAKTDQSKLVFLVRQYILDTTEYTLSYYHRRLHNIPFFFDSIPADAESTSEDSIEFVQDTTYNFMKMNMLEEGIDQYYISSDKKYEKIIGKNDKPMISIEAIDPKFKQTTNIYMSYECLLAFEYINSYICKEYFINGMYSISVDLKLSSVYSFQNQNSNVVVVKSVDQLLAMAPSYNIKKKFLSSKEIYEGEPGVNTVVTITDTEDKEHNLFINIATDKYFESSKYRNDTTESLTEFYPNDTTHYGLFSLHNVSFDDGKYYIVKTDKDNGEHTIFIFNEDTSKELVSKILNY